MESLNFRAHDTGESIIRATVAALLEQGPAMSGDKCMYLASNGNKCAAGQWIPTVLYSEDMEDNPLSSMLNWVDQQIPGGDEFVAWANRHIDALDDLQAFHDSVLRSCWSDPSNKISLAADLIEAINHDVGICDLSKRIIREEIQKWMPHESISAPPA